MNHFPPLPSSSFDFAAVAVLEFHFSIVELVFYLTRDRFYRRFHCHEFYCAVVVVDTSKVNRALLKRCRNQRSLEEAILFFPEKERDAPSILKYTPTYQGFIRQKGTKPADTDKPIQQATTAKLTQQEEKLEEVVEDSFGEIPEFLRLSIPTSPPRKDKGC
ncbi:hypothetical protein RHGRI_026569 [Rhododendron griersonianum]|uniref:Uncharacterized protein n=1 Tax=Rhododendron griersonianum TaxID=479676 RepID=A0AAV6IUU4_9ERIC|nr:hypothetical protein RHGRI_026569 [Rhododendron griersonianum]